MGVAEEMEETKAYAEILKARVAYAQSKFNIGLFTFGFCCALASLWVTGFAAITMIHLWRVWV